MNKKIVTYYTDHFVNLTITQLFAKSNGLTLDSINNYENYQNHIQCSYGIKRGSEIMFKSASNFLYIDHGYMHGSEREFLTNNQTKFKKFDGYFRFVRNDFYFNDTNLNTNSDRFKKLNIPLKDLNLKGEHIILSEPSDDTKNFLNIPKWTENTTELIKKYSNKEIIVHNKFSRKPLNELLNHAYAFVSCQSTAAFKAISEGVPSYFTHPTLNKFGKIEEINNRKLNHELLFVAANNQWKINEFFSSEFKMFLSKIIL